MNAIHPDRTRHPSFYSKIIAGEETALYARNGWQNIPFEHFVWLLWSIKESVYKCRQRIHPHLAFSPKRIIIREVFPFDNPDTSAPPALLAPFALPIPGAPLPSPQTPARFYRGIAEYDDARFYSVSGLHSDCIGSLATDDPTASGSSAAAPPFFPAPGEEGRSGNIWWGIRRVGQTDYDHQSEQVRYFVLNKLQSLFPDTQLRIEKAEAGFPVLLKDGVALGLPLSFSHHHDFIFYSFLHPSSLAEGLIDRLTAKTPRLSSSLKPSC